MIEAGILYACSTLLLAGAAMLGCFVGNPPLFPAATRTRVLLFISVWALVTTLRLGFDLTIGPVNVLFPIALAAVGARLLLVKFSK